MTTGADGRPALVQRLGEPLASLDRAHDREPPRLDVAGGRRGDGGLEQAANVLVGHVELALKWRTLRRLAMTSENSMLLPFSSRRPR